MSTPNSDEGCGLEVPRKAHWSDQRLLPMSTVYFLGIVTAAFYLFSRIQGFILASSVLKLVGLIKV